MLFNYLKRRQILCLLIVSIIFISFINFVSSEEDISLGVEDSIQSEVDFSEKSNESLDDPKQHNLLLMEDSVFSTSKDLTFKHLVSRVTLIVLVLLFILLLVKVFMSRRRFDSPGTLLDNLASKLTGVFSSSPDGLKLKQTLILTPGQNLYIVEISGRKLLLGGTQHGGVQFLADLTQATALNSENQINVMPITRDIKEQSKQVSFPPAVNYQENPFVVSNKVLKVEDTACSSTRQPFKRRTNFRQTLLSNVK